MSKKGKPREIVRKRGKKRGGNGGGWKKKKGEGGKKKDGLKRWRREGGRLSQRVLNLIVHNITADFGVISRAMIRYTKCGRADFVLELCRTVCLDTW